RANVVLEGLQYYILGSLRAINQKRGTELALGVRFSEAVFKGGIRALLKFVTFNCFAFVKKITFDEQTGQTPGLRCHRNFI
ncbi:MAG: hypothetical protein ABJX82_13275, partial [Paracoccaceae bacterium]